MTGGNNLEESNQHTVGVVDRKPEEFRHFELYIPLLHLSLSRSLVEAVGEVVAKALVGEISQRVRFRSFDVAGHSVWQLMELAFCDFGCCCSWNRDYDYCCYC